MMRELRCYARKEGDHYVAMCVDLNVATQADSMEEVKKDLFDAIRGYLICVNQLGDKGKHLLHRRAPLSYWMEYYTIMILQKIISHIHRTPGDRIVFPYGFELSNLSIS